MKKIDVHAHSTMWGDNLPTFGTPLISPEKLKERYNELNIEKGFILPLLSPESRNFVQSNEEIEYIANNNADTFFWFCNIDARMGGNNKESDLSKLLNYYKEKGAKGVGEITANMYIDEPFMDNLFYHCEKCEMPVTIHMSPEKYGCYGVIDDLGLGRLEKMLKKYPKLKILGHSQCFWSEIDSGVTVENRNGYPKGKVVEGAVIRIMRECPNLYCDLSAGSGYNALSRDEDFAYKFIEEFGERLLFGTDFYMPAQNILLAEWLDAAYKNSCITEENYKKICRENAIKIFDLKGE
ncbi:MAG: amidohydrolase family protein [Clostridia bacterium]|nr:amidohydrolase family protein [Clostridia bacterium]